MTHRTNFLALVMVLTFFGCTQNTDRAKMELTEQETVVSTTEQKNNETVERKLIKEGQVEFATSNISSTRKHIFAAVEKYNGYVSADQEIKSPGRKSNTVVIRLPAEHFDNLLREATQGVEHFERKDITVKDVTEDFLDVQARLKTKKELENRFLALLKQAQSVTEILEIEKEIGQLRSEIESIEGRLKYLQDRVSFSTLTMMFYESIPNQTKFGQKFKNGFRKGWDNLIWFFVGLVNIWPFILIGFGLLLGIRLYRRKNRNTVADQSHQDHTA